MRETSGSVMVLVCAVAGALICTLAIVADVGSIYYHKTLLQRATDLAGLAGGQHLPEDVSLAYNTTLSYLEANGVQKSEVGNINWDQNGSEYEVRARRDVPLWFGRLFGFKLAVVEVKSTIVVHGVSEVLGVVPWGQEAQQFVPGVEYVLKWGSGSGSGSYRGNYHVIDLNDRMNTQDYTSWVANDYWGHTVKIGDSIETKTGNLGVATEQGVNERRRRAVGYNCTLPHPAHDCPLVAVAPIVKSFTDANGKGRVVVEGFGRFLITRLESDTSGNVSVYGIYLVRLETLVVDPKAKVWGMKRVFLVN